MPKWTPGERAALEQLSLALAGKTSRLTVTVGDIMHPLAAFDAMARSAGAVQTAAKVLDRLVREELKRLPPEPPHAVCLNCGTHYGTRRLPITVEQGGCVFCMFGTLSREEVKKLYPDDVLESREK